MVIWDPLGHDRVGTDGEIRQTDGRGGLPSDLDLEFGHYTQ